MGYKLVQHIRTFDYLECEVFLLDPGLLELLMLVSPLDKLVYLLSGLEWVNVYIASHVEVIVLEISFEWDITDMSEDACALHLVVLPTAFVGVPIAPNVLAEAMLYSSFQFSNEYALIRIGSDTLSVLLIPIPEAFVFAHHRVIRSVKNLYTRSMSQFLNIGLLLLVGSFFFFCGLFW